MTFALEGSEVIVRLYDRGGRWVSLRVVDAADPPRFLKLEKIRYELCGPRYVEAA